MKKYFLPIFDSMRYAIIKKSRQQLLCLILLSSTVFYAHPQNVRSVPQDIYVGDRAEIYFSFAWNGNLLSDNTKTLTNQNPMLFEQSNVDDLYTVVSVSITQNATGYTLIIVFIPWTPGIIDIPSFDLATVFETTTKPVLIDIPPIEVLSILEKTGENEIRPPMGPVIIPGTTYILLLIIVAVFVACLCLIVIFSHLKPLKLWLKDFHKKMWATAHFKKASRELIKLSKSLLQIDSMIFAVKLSVIIRTYLEGRFHHPFTAETSSDLPAVFDRLFAGTASKKAYEIFHDLYEICLRCDFLHYAGDNTQKAPLTLEEMRVLIARCREDFIFFEKTDESDDNKEGA